MSPKPSTKAAREAGPAEQAPADAAQGKRAVPLWVGATPDAKVPPRVRLRVFEREGGKCWISGRKIGPADLWDLDHKIALCNGGSHSEDNLFPALRDKHREKTAEDVNEKSKVYRIRAKHNGTWPRSSRPLKGRGFAPARKQRTTP